MNYIVATSDPSLYYRASSALDIASLDSTAAWGNLADAMNNATVVIPNKVLLEPPAGLPGPVNSAEIIPITKEPGPESPVDKKYQSRLFVANQIISC